MCKNHQARFLAGCNRPATSFRLSDSDAFVPQTVRIILCKTSPDPTWFWLTVSGLGKTDPVRKQTGVQESSGPLLANASGMFTGNEPWQNIYQARHEEATSWDCYFIEIQKSLEKVSGALSSRSVDCPWHVHMLGYTEIYNEHSDASSSCR